MSKFLNAVKEKFNIVKRNALLRTVLICALSLLLIFSVTLAWYINNLGLWGMEFNTGTIDFNAYVYSENGTRLIGPISPDDEDKGSYINAPLFTINNAQVGSTGTVYIAVESTGSIGIQYRIAFDVTGKSDRATAYLGGYKYTVTKVTDTAVFSNAGNINVTKCPRPEKIDDEIVTIDRNAITGTIQNNNSYDVYRFDYTLVEKSEEYTGNSINFFLNIFATQIGGDFEDTAERGYIYYCSSQEDIDRAKVEGYPGDTIKLSSNIVYYGDLVFTKPINLETNDFILTVNGNLMYDYVLGNSLKLDAGGLGQIVVQCTKEGVGGNLNIKAPLSDVTLTGSNSSNGDIIVEKNISIDATNSFGSPGVSFNNIRIVDNKNSRKTILLESNTRATVSFGTTIGLFQTAVKSNNIEIINNGVIGDINLSNMGLLDQTNSPQIYILNNNDINNPIALPEWSIKFTMDENGKCYGNTRIIQSYSGTPMEVSGSCPFTTEDIEVEHKDMLVEQIIDNNDSRLKIYYQDVDGQVTTIQSILENYLMNEATTGCSLNEVLQLEIISIGTKAITNDDIAFMNSNSMLSLRQLDMQRANMYDTSTGVYDRLPASAFASVSKYEELILPQNLVEIGESAFAGSKIDNIVTMPAGVTTYGKNWFKGGQYVGFAASVPVAGAVSGLENAKAIFVEEPYISSYKSVYSSYATKIYPTSELDEDKEHFVRNIINDEWEITYYIRGEDPVIGADITKDGKILKITSVYDNAYRHNYKTAQISFADSVENLGAANFYANKNITAVNLNNLKTLGADVFNSCTNLAQLVIGDDLETIGANAFLKCESMKQEVILPASMQKIGANAFRQTPITKVNTGGTTSIDGMAFYACGSLTSAELPNVKYIGEDGTNELFSYCSYMVSVDMPALKKVNGSYMFRSCLALHELHMAEKDDGITLGSNAFIGCNMKLIKLYVPEENISFFQSKLPGGIAANMIYPEGEKMGELLVYGFDIGEYIVMNNGDNSYSLVTSNLDFSEELTIPLTYNNNPITKIYNNCFRNQVFTNVTLNLGNNVTSIGDFAFYGLNGLSKVRFGNALQYVGNSAFSRCGNFSQDLVLPASVRTIGNNAFSYTGITSVNTGGATNIYGRAFQSCTSLIYAQFPEAAVLAEDGTNEIFSACGSLVSIDMPKVTKVYGSSMFVYCISLREIYMGSKDANISLGSIPFSNVNTSQIKLFVPADDVQFYSTKGILNATQVFPRGEKLGNKAVNGFVIGDYIVMPNDTGYTLVTSNLDFSGDVVLPSQYKNEPITHIYDNAFRNQSFNNVNMTLGDYVQSIGNRSFYNLGGLKAVVMDNVTTVGVEAFYATGLQMLNGPKLTTFGNSAFRKCASLTTVNLPMAVNIDGTYVFSDCANLTTVYFENIMSVQTYTFQYDVKLTKLTINRLIDEDGGNMPATMTIPASAPCKIYVPYRALNSYPSTWSGKPVVSFDTAVKHNNHTYVLSMNNEGRYELIDFVPASSITSLTMPATLSVDGVNTAIYSIKSGAFTAVSGTLKTLVLSAGIAQLDDGALSECAALQTINVNQNNVYFTSIGGLLYSKDSKMLVKYPIGKTDQLDLSGSTYSSTVAIGAGAFANATKLTKIVFPASLLVIDGSAFENCSKLSTVQFTGTTPPTLMGANIFDTGVTGFKMIIPNTSQEVVTAYLRAYNFAKYEPYIDLGGNSTIIGSVSRNQVSLSNVATNEAAVATLKQYKGLDQENGTGEDD